MLESSCSSEEGYMIDMHENFSYNLVCENDNWICQTIEWGEEFSTLDENPNDALSKLFDLINIEFEWAFTRTEQLISEMCMKHNFLNEDFLQDIIADTMVSLLLLQPIMFVGDNGNFIFEWKINKEVFSYEIYSNHVLVCFKDDCFSVLDNNNLINFSKKIIKLSKQS